MNEVQDEVVEHIIQASSYLSINVQPRIKEKDYKDTQIISS